jgi:uncharacterized protein YcbK (DUF882 family)
MRNFDISEFDCKETGENKMCSEFLSRLDLLRDACGFPFVITSGYRSESHSVEIRKDNPGMHTKGIAADIKVVSGWHRYKIVEAAISMGFKGIGVANGFVHVDDRKSQPVMWQYN